MPQIYEYARNEMGLVTTKRKKTGGKALGVSSMYRVLNNPFYAGIFRYHGKVYKGLHEPMITMEEFERAQSILKRKDHARPKGHLFSYTGMIRCGYCDCSITAFEKIKFIKATKKNAQYVYYCCTKKKQDLKCRQAPITLPELEKQILGTIEKVAIPPEFRDWALEVLRGDHKKEVALREQQYQSLEKRYNDLQGQLDMLISLRLRDLVTDEEMARKRGEIEPELLQVKEKIAQTQNRASRWIDTMEDAFNFVTNVRAAFLKGDIQTKKGILFSLGERFVLQDKKLTIELFEWLKPISNHQKDIQKGLVALEPSKFVSIKAKSDAFAIASRFWGG